MHAVVVRSTIHDFEQGRKFLSNEVVPRVSQTPGVSAAHWVRLEGGDGTAMLVSESEEGARAMAEQIRANPPPSSAVTLNSVEVGEVVEHV